MQHIATETGANITLRGRGSGIQEGDALHIYISAAIPKAFAEAAKLAQNLIDTVKAEHDKQVLRFSGSLNFFKLQRSFGVAVNAHGLCVCNPCITESYRP